MLSPFPERDAFVAGGGYLQDWAQRWLQELRNAVNSALSPTPGPFADDAAAAAGKIAVGKQYYKPTGEVFVRLS